VEFKDLKIDRQRKRSKQFRELKHCQGIAMETIRKYNQKRKVETKDFEEIY